MTAEFMVEHSSADLGELCERLTGLGVARVAIERPHGPVVDSLVDTSFGPVIVVSRSVKALQEHHGKAGIKSDHTDAYVFADALRTDGHR